MSVQVKICGLKNDEAIHAVNQSKPAFAGFVHFARSPRHLSISEMATLSRKLLSSIASVAVVVNPDDALLTEIITQMTPAFIQLHGHETPQRVAEIRAQFPQQKLIKAISISTKEDLTAAPSFESLVDMLLFDAKPPKDASLPGGNGISFDWKLLAGFNASIPWILSGGLNTKNIQEAIRLSDAKMVDVSSGVEREPGVKDASLIDAFMKAAHS